MATKKLTLKNIMKEMPEIKTTEVSLTGGEYYNDITLTVKHNLTLKEAMGFIEDLVNTCLDTENGKFMPESFDFSIRMYVLVYYAGIDISKDAEKAYSVLYCTDLFDRIFPIIDKRQFDVLVNAATSHIEHWRNMMVSTAASKVNDLLQKMDDIMAGSNDVLEKLDDASFREAMERILKMNAPSDISELNDSITETAAVETEENPVVAKAKKILSSPIQDPNGNVVYLPRTT